MRDFLQIQRYIFNEELPQLINDRDTAAKSYVIVTLNAAWGKKKCILIKLKKAQCDG